MKINFGKISCQALQAKATTAATVPTPLRCKLTTVQVMSYVLCIYIVRVAVL